MATIRCPQCFKTRESELPQCPHCECEEHIYCGPLSTKLGDSIPAKILKQIKSWYGSITLKIKNIDPEKKTIYIALALILFMVIATVSIFAYIILQDKKQENNIATYSANENKEVVPSQTEKVEETPTEIPPTQKKGFLYNTPPPPPPGWTGDEKSVAWLRKQQKETALKNAITNLSVESIDKAPVSNTMESLRYAIGNWPELINTPFEENGNKIFLIHAASATNNLEAVDFLVKQKANIDHDLGGGATPLLLAIIKKREKTALKLIELGAKHDNMVDSGKGDGTKYSILYLAKENGLNELVELLKKKGMHE